VDRVATVEKSRDGSTGEKFPFELDVVELGADEDGDPVTTCIVRHIESDPHAKRPAKPLTGVAKVGLQALQEAITDHGQVMPGTSTIPSGVRAVTLDQWRIQFRLRYGTDGEVRGGSAVRTAFHRAREQLAKFDEIGVSDPYVWISR
jgi:hypothetical protein